MSIIPLLLFCSLVLVAGSVVLFIVSARQGDCHQAERMCLLPLEDDDPKPHSPLPQDQTGAAPDAGSASAPNRDS